MPQSQEGREKAHGPGTASPSTATWPRVPAGFCGGQGPSSRCWHSLEGHFMGRGHKSEGPAS